VLQLVCLVVIGNSECVQVSAAAHLELGDATSLLYLNS